MLKRIIYIVFAFYSLTVTAQRYEIGLFGGGSNFIGDVGNEQYVNPNKLAYGAFFKWNINDRFAARVSYNYTNLLAADSLASSPGRVLRNFKVGSNIHEFGLGFEFNFFPYNLHELRFQHTPYVYTGVDYFSFKDRYLTSSNTIGYNTNYTFAMPFAVGYKMAFINHVTVGVEVGMRYTMTDNIDGSAMEDVPFSFGNPNSNDWYMFSGLTVSYFFGRKPCYSCYD